MDLYRESCSLVWDLWHEDVLKRGTAAQPWIAANCAPMLVEIGRDLLQPLVTAEKVPPIVSAFGRHRQKLWSTRQIVLPKMTCRDNLRQPGCLVRASWNEFFFAQFTVVPGSIFVSGQTPAWATDIGLRAPGGFWISNQWQHCFEGNSLSLADYVAQKCCLQFEVFRESYRTPR